MEFRAGSGKWLNLLLRYIGTSPNLPQSQMELWAGSGKRLNLTAWGFEVRHCSLDFYS